MALTGIRATAEGHLSRVPALGKEIRSSLPTGKDNQLFTDLTNTPHSRMKQDWDGYPDKNGVPTKPKGIMTGCNGFTGWYTTMLGQPVSKPLGVFEIETFLKRYKMEAAWVPSTKDNRPQYGDVVRWKTKYHVCVSEGFDGDTWNHVDAGQGGSKTTYDILKRVREKEPYHHSWLIGWLNIEAAFGSGAGAIEVPDWMQTWWMVNWQGSTFYYLFDSKGKVTWSNHRPQHESQGHSGDGEPGRFSIDKSNKVTITWPLGTETFQWKPDYSIAGEKMTGLNSGDFTTAETYFY